VTSGHSATVLCKTTRAVHVLPSPMGPPRSTQCSPTSQRCRSTLTRFVKSVPPSASERCELAPAASRTCRALSSRAERSHHHQNIDWCLCYKQFKCSRPLLWWCGCLGLAINGSADFLRRLPQTLHVKFWSRPSEGTRARGSTSRASCAARIFRPGSSPLVRG